jgi:3-methylcrotonyl-CoA carboxylase alpha subunit
MAKRVQLSDGEAVWRVTISGDSVDVEPGGGTFQIAPTGADRIRIAGDAGDRVGTAAGHGDAIWIGIDGEVFAFRVARGAASRGGAGDHEALSPPMSATVVRIAVKVGDRVTAGDLLVALEAMKMELPIRAPRDGTVQAVHCREGELVQPGTALVTIE